MDIAIKQYLERAGNELRLASILKNLSGSKEKVNFGAEKEDTFYSSVISHSYYAIFYAAKAILLTKNIKTDLPEVHKKTLEEFKKNFVDSGILDVELLKIYNRMIIRADELLGLFQQEKKKRGEFVYKTLPQANIEPAQESIENAKKFVSHIKMVVEK
jgi:uncharacterized protein (UPF0332 family)